MKKVMVRAWEIARQAARTFGGKVREFFAESLKMAWKEMKATVVYCDRKEVKEVSADFVKVINERINVLRGKGKEKTAQNYVTVINLALAKANANDNIFKMMDSINNGNTGLKFSDVVNGIIARYSYILK